MNGFIACDQSHKKLGRGLAIPTAVSSSPIIPNEVFADGYTARRATMPCDAQGQAEKTERKILPAGENADYNTESTQPEIEPDNSTVGIASQMT